MSGTSYPVGIVPPRTKSPVPESSSIASYVTLRKNKKSDSRTVSLQSRLSCKRSNLKDISQHLSLLQLFLQVTTLLRSFSYFGVLKNNKKDNFEQFLVFWGLIFVAQSAAVKWTWFGWNGPFGLLKAVWDEPGASRGRSLPVLLAVTHIFKASQS